jgi:prophage regulatory protein
MNQKDRIIRLPEVMFMVGMKKTAIYDKIKEGAFPAPLKIGRMSGWLESDVQQWIAAVAEEHAAA